MEKNLTFMTNFLFIIIFYLICINYKYKFIKENQGSILDAFIGNSKNKDFFSFILKIRNRLNQLEVIIANLINILNLLIKYLII